MEIIEGSIVQKIKCLDWSTFVDSCAKLQSEGYKVKKASRKICWPTFWIVEYKAVMVKEFVYDSETKEYAFITDSIPL